MVQVQLRLRVPEHGADDFVEALRAVLRPVRLNRECLAVRIFRDLDAPDAMCCVEDWSNEAAAARRVDSASFSQLLGLMEASPSPPGLEFRFVSAVRGLEFVEAVRGRSSLQRSDAQNKE